MPSPTHGFRDTDWQGTLHILRALHAQSLSLRTALVPYTAGFRNRGDTMHDAIHTLAYRLGAPENFLRGECDVTDPSRAPGCSADLHPTRAPASL